MFIERSGQGHFGDSGQLFANIDNQSEPTLPDAKSLATLKSAVFPDSVFGTCTLTFKLLPVTPIVLPKRYAGF